MDLFILFDEERMVASEEKSRPAEEERDGWSGGNITWRDTSFKRVRLFKSEAVIKKNRDSKGDSQSLPLYVLIEDSYNWVGEDPRWPAERQRRRTYVTGPDCKRIREAVKIAESYGGKLNTLGY